MADKCKLKYEKFQANMMPRKFDIIMDYFILTKNDKNKQIKERGGGGNNRPQWGPNIIQMT